MTTGDQENFEPDTAVLAYDDVSTPMHGCNVSERTGKRALCILYAVWGHSCILGVRLYSGVTAVFCLPRGSVHLCGSMADLLYHATLTLTLTLLTISQP